MNARRLLWIGAVALCAVIGAFWLSSPSAALPRAVQVGDAVLPGLAGRLNAITEVRIARGDGTTTTLRRGESGWRVLERDFPADESQIRRLLLDAAALEIVEEKTSDPNRYALLQVEDPGSANARGTLLSLLEDGKADNATSLILGKTDGSRNLFVRPLGAATTLLASPQLLADAEPRRWLSTALLDIKAERVRRVSITARDQPTYIADRGPDDASPLALTAVPAGREVADPATVEAVAGALADLRIEDVLPREAPGDRSLPSGAEARFRNARRFDAGSARTRTGHAPPAGRSRPPAAPGLARDEAAQIPRRRRGARLRDRGVPRGHAVPPAGRLRTP
ncbi:MAG: DUF4340 domain-containing protein [Steroidobacteraceae bacterium]